MVSKRSLASHSSTSREKAKGREREERAGEKERERERPRGFNSPSCPGEEEREKRISEREY